LIRIIGPQFIVVWVLAIAFDSVDLGAGSFSGPLWSVVGLIGALLAITGLPFVLDFEVAWVTVFTGSRFFPNRTDAGRGLMFFTTGRAIVAVFFNGAT